LSNMRGSASESLDEQTSQSSRGPSGFVFGTYIIVITI
jgi:hypothetical protein